MVGVEEVLALGAVAVVASEVMDEEKEHPNKPAEWGSGPVIASYSEGGVNFEIEAQTGKNGTVVQDLYRMKIKGEDRFPDPTNPGNLLFQSSNYTYRTIEEITQEAQDWVDSIPEPTPPGPVGPQPGPTPQPGRPQLPDTGGATLGSEISNPDDFNIDDLRNAGRYGDTEIVHVNQEEIEMLTQAGGSNTINPQTGLREFFTNQPNLSTNIKEQLNAFLDGEESCFDFVTGESSSPFTWNYSDRGKVLQLDDDDYIGVFSGGNSLTSATIGLRIAAGYTVGMVTSVEGGVLAKKDAGTDEVFDVNYLTPTKSGTVARYNMVAGDVLQIDIDGQDGGIGDFVVTSGGQQITKSVSVDNDVFLTISSVDYTPSTQQLDIDDIVFDEDQVIIEPQDDDFEEEERERRSQPPERSPIMLMFMAVALAAAAWFVFVPQQQGFRTETGGMQL
tara:strand:- start:1284 stop:2621 length:1338 start_codon:yes stop_codon:yes gene_type:complete